MRSFTRRLALAMAVALTSGVAFADDKYPQREVKLVVPFTAGSTADVLARGLAEELKEIWKQPVVIDNRPGATGIVAAETVVRAEPDGSTILFDGATTFAGNMYLHASLPYDTEKDLVPVTRLFDLWLALIVRGSFPAETANDFVDKIKSGSDRYTYGSSGIGTSPHLVIEGFKAKTGAKITHVPYKGTAETVTNLLADRLDATHTNMIGVAGHVKAGRLKMLGYSGPNRLPAFPDVKTLREQGLGDLDVGSFYGLAVPAGTPKPIIDKIATDVAAVIHSQSFKDKYLIPAGMTAVGDTPEQFSDFLVGARQRMKELVRLSGIQIK